jgi:uroporphyrinogen-III synthase
LKVKSILISQPAPADLEKSPYTRLVEKYNLEIDYRKFIKIEGLSSKEFRQNKINIADYTAVILTSRQAVDHYFRIAKELRYMVPETMKYFCISESTAFYLQKYVQFRKRKIFHGNQSFEDLMDVMKKYKSDKFLYPCSEIHKPDIPEKLKKNKFHFKTAVLYRTLAADLSDLDLDKYEMLVFFSPSGIKSLFTNFPDFQQGEKEIATFGATTAKAAKEFGLKVTIEAPTQKAPSMSMAIDDFIREQRKRKR